MPARPAVSPPKPLRGAVALAPVNVAVVDREAYGDDAACEAVIVVEPAPTIVTTPVDGLIVATAVSELVKVNAPLLDDVGGDIVKDESPKVFDGATNAPKVGEAGLTTNVVVLVDAV